MALRAKDERERVGVWTLGAAQYAPIFLTSVYTFAVSEKRKETAQSIFDNV